MVSEVLSDFAVNNYDHIIIIKYVNVVQRIPTRPGVVTQSHTNSSSSQWL